MKPTRLRAAILIFPGCKKKRLSREKIDRPPCTLGFTCIIFSRLTCSLYTKFVLPVLCMSATKNRSITRNPGCTIDPSRLRFLFQNMHNIICLRMVIKLTCQLKGRQTNNFFALDWQNSCLKVGTCRLPIVVGGQMIWLNLLERKAGYQNLLRKKDGNWHTSTVIIIMVGIKQKDKENDVLNSLLRQWLHKTRNFFLLLLCRHYWERRSTIDWHMEKNASKKKLICRENTKDTRKP